MPAGAVDWRFWGLTWQQCQSLLLAAAIFAFIALPNYIFSATVPAQPEQQRKPLENPHPGVLEPVPQRQNAFFEWLRKQAAARKEAREVKQKLSALQQKQSKAE
jgi:hypothetical protein